MADSSTSTVETLQLEITQILLKIANLPDKATDEIDPGTPLFEAGLGIDSIDMLELIVELDKKYGFKIKNNDAGRQTLRNVRSIATAIEAFKILPLK